MSSPADGSAPSSPRAGRKALSRWVRGGGAAVVAALACWSVWNQLAGPRSRSNPPPADSTVSVSIPRGLVAITWPEGNAPTPERIALGSRLFFETALSRNHSLSCASCHDPDYGFSSQRPFAEGVNGDLGKRRPSTLVNVAYNNFQFWDGRIGGLSSLDSLERQSLEPIRDHLEMDLSPESAAERLNASTEYRQQFERAYGAKASPALIASALASFERTLLFGDSPYDRFEAGEKSALSPAAARGKELFFWRATCSACHRGFNLTDNAFHPSVASRDTEGADPGRLAVTNQPQDRGVFKTPTLRDVARRAPYMHDGSLATLEEVVARYNEGGFDTHYWPPEKRDQIEQLINSAEGEGFRRTGAPNLRAGFPLHLTAAEQADLVAFLREGLTSNSVPQISRSQNSAAKDSTNESLRD